MNELCQLVGTYRGEFPADGQQVVQQKIDGFRCLYFAGIDGVKRLWSRNGIPLNGLAHILARCRAMEEAAGCDLFLDGEFQVSGTLLATKAWCERAWKLGGCNGTFFAFDCLSFADWQRGGTDQPWLERQERLHELVAATEDIPREPSWASGASGEPVPERYVQALSGELILSHAGVVRAAEEVWAAGGEGLVLKRIDSPYRRNRTSDWLKVKQEQKWRIAA